MHPGPPPLFHLAMSPLRRAAGRSAVAASAYRSASRMVDLRTGLVADYRRKRDVAPLPLVLPPGAPETGREAFWNAVEAHHRRKDAVTARELDAALPQGLSREQEATLAERFARWLAETFRVAVDVGLHRMPGNPHVDILLSANEVLPDGRLGKKVCELDAVARQRTKGAPNPVEAIRAKWAELTNQTLADAGRVERVDHKSYALQGVPLIPTFHLGRAVTAMERKNPGSTEVGARLAEIKAINERARAGAERPSHERSHERPQTPRPDRGSNPARRPRARGLRALAPVAEQTVPDQAASLPGPLRRGPVAPGSRHRGHR